MNELEKLKLAIEIKDQLEYNRVFLDWPYDNDLLDNYVVSTVDTKLSDIQSHRDKLVRMCNDAFLLKVAEHFNLDRSQDIEQQLCDINAGDGVLNISINKLSYIDYYSITMVYAYDSSILRKKEKV